MEQIGVDELVMAARLSIFLVAATPGAARARKAQTVIPDPKRSLIMGGDNGITLAADQLVMAADGMLARPTIFKQARPCATRIWRLDRAGRGHPPSRTTRWVAAPSSRWRF